MPGDFISAVVHGNRRTAESLLMMDKGVDLATRKALQEVGRVTKRSIRREMKGAPRWNHRGPSDRTGEAVTVAGPEHSPRTGGPGYFTGHLYGSIKASRRPRVRFHAMSTAVFAGGAGNVQNLYKAQQEAKFPYFKPGVRNAEPKMPAIWEKHWGAATKVF